MNAGGSLTFLSQSRTSDFGKVVLPTFRVSPSLSSTFPGIPSWLLRELSSG